jgi:hypothetical protein
VRVAADVEPIQGVRDCKDAARARVEADVVVVVVRASTAVAAAADGYLICELGEEVVEIGERRGPEGGRGAWRGLRRGRLVIGRGVVGKERRRWTWRRRRRG